MQTLCVLGPGSDEAIEAIADRLDGRVATIERLDTTGEPPETATASYGLTDDGTWIGAGVDQSFDRLLDELAPEYDYLLADGFSRHRIPTVLIGDDVDNESVAGDVVFEYDDPDAIDPDEVADRIDEFEPYVTLETLVDRVKDSPEAERSGAIATFTGRVRAKDAPDDSRTEALEFEKYEGVAEERMADLEGELTDRDGVYAVEMHHRVGRIEYGEDIVFVVVLAGHREEAFRTVKDGIDRLKEEVPIFKKERTTDEEFWVHEKSG